MSQRLVREASFKAFSRPCCAVTLPGTTVRARTSSSGEFRARRMASASSVPGSVSMITFLAAASGFAAGPVPLFSFARVMGAPAKATTASARAMDAEHAAWRKVAFRAIKFEGGKVLRTLLRAPRERSEDSALQSFTDCGIIMGITSGQGPPSPQNGSRLSSGRRGVNTKLSASESFPQSANEFHKRTEQYENRDEY